MAPSLNQAVPDRRRCNCRQWVLSLMGPAPTPAAGPACGWGEAAWTGITGRFDGSGATRRPAGAPGRDKGGSSGLEGQESSGVSRLFVMLVLMPCRSYA